MQEKTNIEEKKLIIKRGILDNSPRQLIINPEFIKFETENLRSDLITIFEKHEIKDYQFGIRWIRGIEFTIGREYQILIRNHENKIIKISFKSYYGYKKTELHKLYAHILKEIWSNFFSEIADNFLEKFNRNETFTIGDVIFTKDDLTINISGIFTTDKSRIVWNKVRTKDYSTYFAIYSIENPKDINRGYSYLNDWNTEILYCVVRTILRDKKIEIYE